MKVVITVSLFLLLVGCSAERKAGRSLEASRVVTTYRTLSDHNDYYFEIRENNYFRFYMKLFDSIPNTQYSGSYTQTGDTLFLKYFRKEGASLIGKKALVNAAKKEIIFFDDFPVVKRSFPFN